MQVVARIRCDAGGKRQREARLHELLTPPSVHRGVCRLQGRDRVYDVLLQAALCAGSVEMRFGAGTVRKAQASRPSASAARKRPKSRSAMS
jgi:hypothetical protein